MTRPQLAIVGAGAAGTLTAIALLREAASRELPVHITLIDPHSEAGRGVAYSTTDLRHRLNVPAGRMSALADDAEHLLRWARQEIDPATDAADFLPRASYGRYLSETLTAAELAGPGRLVRRQATANGAETVDGGVRIRLADGVDLHADAVVLAPGVGAPGVDWAPEALRTSERFVADPWAPNALARIAEEPGDVLLVGSGLTMVDVALTLASEGRTLHAISRHGLAPATHRTRTRGKQARACPPPDVPKKQLDIAEARRLVRTHLVEGTRQTGDWRIAFDSLRPVTAQLWQRLTLDGRAEFLRDDARTWDVHRHRMAPDVAAEVARLRATRALALTRARLVDTAERADGLHVELSDERTLQVAYVVNCTGPQSDPARQGNPLLDSLIAAGTARADPLRLGLDTDASGRLVDQGENASATLYTLGAPRRGSLWESTAIPEIRAQASGLATTLLDLSAVALAPSLAP